MSDIDRVFARMGGGQASPNEQRELRSIPRRGGATGNRLVEVVRVPARGDTTGRKGGAQRPAFNVHAQTWEDGFPARSVRAPSLARAPEPALAAAAEPVAHIMPMWEPSVGEPEAGVVPPAPAEAALASKQGRTPRTRPAASPAPRRVADPFDTSDEGANCLRCGYLVELARERRGLMTCAGCG